jgi:hypothetical protein
VKNEESLRRRRAAIRAVLGYLITNPDAKDTIEGVRRWWLPEGDPEQSHEELQEALQFLVSKDWLTARVTSQQKIYGLNKVSFKEIESYLNNSND